ncbi:hypothetical protein [Paenibacillus assamensis]|uniref:hypothetical protein n=1 Tax=Paenibacillus assamensis TaxID=311244 RepID=UPI0004252A39|nr:hypothetical protein [Paenibacillus assamensis]
MQLFIDFRDQNDKHIVVKNIDYNQVTNGKFVTLSGDGQVPANANSAIVYAIIRSAKDGGSGTMYVDDIHLSYSVGQERLYNGEFNTYSNDEEIANSWRKELWNAVQGQFQVQSFNEWIVQRVEGKGIQKSGMVAISQDIKVNPNRTYELSGTLNILMLKKAKVQLYVDFFDKDNRHLEANVIEHVKPTEGQYITLQRQGIIPKQANRAIVYVIVRATEDGGEGSIRVDKMSLEYQ